MRIIECEQQSDEWFSARLGKVTASHFKDVLNKKSGRETYMMRLLAERITRIREESYSNKYMEDGVELEPEAREHYEWITDNEVEQVGFVEATEDVGCSPDGLIGMDGMLEIKCPKVTTHLGYIIKGVLPASYKAQVQGQLWVCSRQWCDFVSYAPDYEKQPMFRVRVERDEAYLSLLSAAVATFVTELHELEKKL
jgi:putative phage-type endonuclease